ncbi:MAG: anti-sigma factor family protein [Calditrichia bacterium]
MNEIKQYSFLVDQQGHCSVEGEREQVLERYLLSAMSEEESSAFVEHLLFCQKCSRELKFREQLRQSLRNKPVDEQIAARAEAVLEARVRSGASSVKWYRYAAVAAIILLMSIPVYLYSTAKMPLTTWGELAVISEEDKKPVLLQSLDSSTFDNYNQAVNTLYEAQPRGRWIFAQPLDSAGVRSAISSLEDSYRQSLPRDVHVDVTIYLFKANLMLNHPGRAIEWMNRAVETRANRLKMERCLELVQQMRRFTKGPRGLGGLKSFMRRPNKYAHLDVRLSMIERELKYMIDRRE